MIRTVISLDPDDKAWLDRRAEEEHVTMTQIVRTAIRHYREELEAPRRPTFEQLLERTAGLWKREDGLTYQQRVREEWER
jgi:predicted transcriptional regulator